jgi:DNA oxidative demethylase
MTITHPRTHAPGRPRPDELSRRAYPTTCSPATRTRRSRRHRMHQDKDEAVNEPVVSLSIGDTCRFRFGNADNRGKPYTDIDLASGDAFVFGRQARFAYHGVPKIYPGTCDPDCGLPHGRINITMRVTGLIDQ